MDALDNHFEHFLLGCGLSEQNKAGQAVIMILFYFSVLHVFTYF